MSGGHFNYNQYLLRDCSENSRGYCHSFEAEAGKGT